VTGVQTCALPILAAAIPHAEALEFPDGGHLFPVSRTEAFVTTLAAWIYANVPPA
jgi:pimeloyl-ACP methyl ester carboxylesterase